MIPRLTMSTLLIVGFSVSAFAQSAGNSRSKSVGERIFGFLDKNGDKSIDSKEFGEFSASMKTWLTKHGMDGSKSIYRTDFLVVCGRMLRDLRKAQPRIGVAAPSTNGTNNAVVVSPAKGTPTANGTAPSTIEQTVAAGTAELPIDYQAGDLNRDGQIDFFEWRKFKRTEMARFYQLDANKDYVLSLAELGGAPAGASVGGTAESGTTSTAANTATVSTGPSRDRLDNIKWVIGEMDKNGNKKIDPAEWIGSKRIGPAFKKAKIDLSKPMTETEFAAHYNKVFPEEGKEEKDKSTDKKGMDKAEKSEFKDKEFKDKSDKRERKKERRGFRDN